MGTDRFDTISLGEGGWIFWCEAVTDSYDFEDSEFEGSQVEDRWLNKLYGRESREAAAIINRAYKLYHERDFTVAID